MLDEKDERSLVHVERIRELNPIPGADRIEVATIRGWKVVVKKDQFRVGDTCAYFEIDSILPFTPWSEFLRNKDKPDKPIRLRTVKLRGQQSQGLAMPLRDVFPVELPKVALDEGADLTSLLGVTKYEPPIPAELAGLVKGKRPWFVPKTDEERLQNIPEIIKRVAGVRMYRSVKLNGTSASYFYFANLPEEDRFGVCSRNLELKEQAGNTYWRMATKYDLKTKLAAMAATGNSYVIQAELNGPGIQKNMYGLKEHELFVFNVYDITASRYLNYDEFIAFCNALKLTTVPIENDNVVLTGNETVEELLALADGTYPNGHLREGLVWRPVMEMKSDLLSDYHNCRLSFKTVSNMYLLKEGE